jgi:ATP-dependent DNA ligase
MFEAVCKLGLEGIVSKKLNGPYKSGPSKVCFENQKFESTRCYAGVRWNVLT